jgi:hypothetical protein
MASVRAKRRAVVWELGSKRRRLVSRESLGLPKPVDLVFERGGLGKVLLADG